MADLTQVLKLKSYLSGAEIKTLYEGEPDTNAYSNAEKSKVDNTTNRTTDLEDYTEDIDQRLISLYEASEDTTISIPLSPYGVNSFAYSDQALLGRHFPYKLYLTNVILTLETAPVGSSFQVDVKRNGTSIFSTPITVDSAETSSITATVPYVLSSSQAVFEPSDLITFDITQVGATTPGRYPVLTINGVRGPITALVVPLSPLGVNATLESNLALLGQYFPYDFLIEDVVLTLSDAPTGSSFVVDIKKNGVSIFSTLLSVDATELTSVTAAVPYVLSTTTFAKGDLITFDITQIGATLPGRYPVIAIIGRDI